MWGIIGGTGFETFDDFEIVEELPRTTPFGECSSGFKKVRVDGTECLFIPRHGQHHELLPSEINTRANVFALKQNGADKCVTFSAVGSLQHELGIGHLAIPSQFINKTGHRRPATFCGQGVVGHVSLAKPTWMSGREKLRTLASTLDFPVHCDVTYVCMEGPTFSTQAESHMYRQMGGDLIGMTAYPEYPLLREAGICYLPCCFVTDYDCWDDSIEHVSIQQILEIMRQNNTKAFGVLRKLLQEPPAVDDHCRYGGLSGGLMTPLEHVAQEHRQWLDVLMR